MSLARAFTTRRTKQSVDGSNGGSSSIFGGVYRSNTTSKPAVERMGSIRHKISAPQDLIHATNMVAYTAPDLHPKSAASSPKLSDEDSDNAHTDASSPLTSPDFTCKEDLSVSPEPNHLSCFFMAPGQQPVLDAPHIPQRAPSHTKKASYDNLVQKQSSSRSSTLSGRTVSSKASSIMSRASSSTSASSTASSSHGRYSKPTMPSMPTIAAETPAPPATLPTRQPSQRRHDTAAGQHPFGQELAQVSEIAETFGVKEMMQEVAAEEQWLASQGLHSLRADDYLSEIHGLFAVFFKPEAQHAAAPAAMWI